MINQITALFWLFSFTTEIHFNNEIVQCSWTIQFLIKINVIHFRFVDKNEIFRIYIFTFLNFKLGT